MLKSFTKIRSVIGVNELPQCPQLPPSVPLEVFTRFADEVARIARTNDMSPMAREQLSEELASTYALITNQNSRGALLFA